jgi:hypothetical protein
MVAHGHYATITTNGHLEDASGLGRWSSASFSGRGGKILHVITAYRTCNGSIQTAPIGSTFLREYDFFASKVMCVQIPGHTSFETSSPSLLHYQCLPEHPLFLCWTQMQPWIKKLYLRSLSPRAIYMTYIMQVRLHRHILDHLTANSTAKETLLRSGTLSYIKGPQSDHRGLFVDLDTRMLGFNHTFQNFTPPRRRALITGNPELVEVYLKNMHQYYKDHDMITRINRLHREHINLTKDATRRSRPSYEACRKSSPKSPQKVRLVSSIEKYGSDSTILATAAA